MNNASGAEGREQGERTEAELLFPSDGHFSMVVPLSQTGGESARAAVARASAEAEEQEETLVPGRVNRGPRTAHTALAKKGVEQSWAFMAVVLVLSVASGLAAGVYLLRTRLTAESYSPDTPAVNAAPAGDAEGKALGAQPAAGPPAPQTSAPAPQAPQDKLAAVSDSNAAPYTPDVSSPREADTKIERDGASTRTPKASAHAAGSELRRTLEAEPRTERPARAAAAEARDASPAPKLVRPDAGPRRAGRRPPAAAAAPERAPLVSAPPPSARPKKVIQWP